MAKSELEWIDHLHKEFDQYLRHTGFRHVEGNKVSYLPSAFDPPREASNSISDRKSLTAMCFELSTEVFCLAKITEHLGDGLLVDVGCGESRLFELMCNGWMFPPYIGIDIRSEPLLKYSNNKNALLIATDAIKFFPVKEDTAQVVVLSEVLEHLTLDQDRALLKNIYTALKPLGSLVITVPIHPPDHDKDMAVEYKKWNHVTYLHKPEMIQMLADTGFSVVECWGSRFIGDRIHKNRIKEGLQARYGSGAVEFWDTLCKIWGLRIATNMAAHVVDDMGAHLQIRAVAVK